GARQILKRRGERIPAPPHVDQYRRRKTLRFRNAAAPSELLQRGGHGFAPVHRFQRRSEFQSQRVILGHRAALQGPHHVLPGVHDDRKPHEQFRHRPPDLPPAFFRFPVQVLPPEKRSRGGQHRKQRHHSGFAGQKRYETTGTQQNPRKTRAFGRPSRKPFLAAGAFRKRQNQPGPLQQRLDASPDRRRLQPPPD